MPLRNKSHLPAGVDGQMGVCVEICVRLASSSAISAFLGAAPGDPAGSRPCAAECPRFELAVLRGNASDRSRSGTVRWLSAMRGSVKALEQHVTLNREECAHRCHYWPAQAIDPKIPADAVLGKQQPSPAGWACIPTKVLSMRHGILPKAPPQRTRVAMT